MTGTSDFYNVSSPNTYCCITLINTCTSFLLAGPCLNPYKVDMKDATIGHFREDCTKICGGETENVPAVNRHRLQVVKKVSETLRTVNLLPIYEKNPIN